MLKYLHGLAEADGIDANLLQLRKLDIRMCNGCLTCEKGGKNRRGVCSIKDDMQAIYPKLLSADLIVFGTPVYFYMLSGLLKNFMDRTCAIWPRLEGKCFAGVAVAEEGIGSTVDNLKTYASTCGMKWVGSVTALARKPRQVAGDEKVMRDIKHLMRKLKNATA
jgi:multimeric flavodoxin WrbA